MSTAATTDARELFGQAIRTFQSVLKSGVEIQEESTNWFTEMLDGLDSPEPWQERSVTLIDDAASQANIDEANRLMNRNAEASLELLQTAFDAGVREFSPDARPTIHELWETLQEIRHIMSVTRTLIRQLQSHALVKVRKGGREVVSAGNGNGNGAFHR